MAQIDYTKFQMSLERLVEQHENYLTPNPSRSTLDQEGVAESVIQRFETCYDCLWKVLKRYLGEELAIPDTPNSPKPILKLAAENNLFDVPLDQWLDYAQARTGTSHDYDGAKAQACLELAGHFISDAIDLFQTMTGEPWD